MIRERVTTVVKDGSKIEKIQMRRLEQQEKAMNLLQWINKKPSSFMK